MKKRNEIGDRLLLLEHVRERALAASLAILVRSHEHTCAAVRVRALHALVTNLRLIVVTSNLVVLEDAHRDILVAVNGLLRLGENLLLLLLALTSLNWNHDVNRGLLLQVAGFNSHVVDQLRPSEEQFSALQLSVQLGNLGADALNCFRAVDGQGNCATRQCLHEDLHLVSVKFDDERARFNLVHRARIYIKIPQLTRKQHILFALLHFLRASQC